MTKGATRKNATMMPKAANCPLIAAGREISVSSSFTAAISPRPPEEPRRLDQQDDDHDDKYDRIRRFGIEDLGQALDHAKREAGDDRAHDGAHAADHHHRENHDDEIGAHERADLVDGGGHHAGKRGEGYAETIGQGDHARHIDAEGLHETGIFRRRPKIGAELRPLDDKPGAEAQHQRDDHDPATVDRQEHEAEIEAADERGRDVIGLPGGAVFVLKQALDDERQTEGEEQAVKVIELVEPAQHAPLEHDPDSADDDRRYEQSPPVIDAELGKQEPRAKRSHHVERAVGEIDDVEKSEDHREAEAQQGVERAVDQSDQQLSEQCLGRHAEQMEHQPAFDS